MAEFLPETMKTQRQKKNFFKDWEKNCQLRIPQSAKIPLKNESKIKVF